MACTITITKVEGLNLDANGDPQTILVYGTASECPDDIVDVGIGNQWTSANVAADGTWVAEFPGIAKCDREIKVEARCAEDRDCTTGSEPWTVVCPFGDCPTITLSMAGQDPCEGPLRPVKLQATITNAPSPTIYEWDFGDGTTSNAQVFSSNPVEITHLYDPTGGPYTVTLRIVYPEGCPSEDLTLRGINPCESDCPDTVALEVRDSAGQLVNTDPDEPCLPPRDYTITVVQPPPSTSLSYSWSVDGTIINQYGQSYIHSLQSATSPSISVIVSPADCPSLSDGVVLNACVLTPTPTPTPSPTPTPTTTPPERSSCAGLVWAAVIALALGVILLAIYGCTGYAPLQVIAWILIALYVVLMLLWKILEFFGICQPDKCEAAKIHMLILGPLAAILGFIMAFFPCVNTAGAVTILTVVIGIWAPIAAACID